MERGWGREGVRGVEGEKGGCEGREGAERAGRCGRAWGGVRRAEKVVLGVKKVFYLSKMTSKF